MDTANRRRPIPGSAPSKPVKPTNPEFDKAFDAEAFLRSEGIGRTFLVREPNELIFAQGTASDAVYFIIKGTVKLTVVSATGKEALIGLIGRSNFIGEQAVAGPVVQRTATARAKSKSSLLRITRPEMLRVIREEHAFSDRFIAHLLSRASRTENDLTDQLFNSTEKRLARALLLMANFGKAGEPRTVIPNISQDELAQMVGSTRTRVNLLLNRFRRLGYIQYNGVFHVYRTLLAVVLKDTA